MLAGSIMHNSVKKKSKQDFTSLHCLFSRETEGRGLHYKFIGSWSTENIGTAEDRYSWTGIIAFK